MAAGVRCSAAVRGCCEAWDEYYASLLARAAPQRLEPGDVRRTRACVRRMARGGSIRTEAQYDLARVAWLGVRPVREAVDVEARSLLAI